MATDSSNLAYHENLPNGRNLHPQQPIGGSGCSFWSGLLWTLFALIFILVGVWVTLGDHRNFLLLKQQGQATTAVITHLERIGGKDSTTYRMQYQFQASQEGDMFLFQGESKVRGSQYSLLETGQPIAITYLPSDPYISTVDPEVNPTNWLAFLLFSGGGSLLLFFGLWTLIRGLKTSQMNRRLQQEGKIARGVILNRWKESEQGSTLFVIAYAFEVHLPRLGYPWIARAEINRAAYEVLDRGEPVRVRYLPDEPDICQLLDFPV